MKNAMVSGILALLVLAMVACGASDGSSEAVSLMNDMTKANDNFATSLNKASKPDDIVSAMETYTKKMKNIQKVMKEMSKKYPNLGKNGKIPASMNTAQNEVKTSEKNMRNALKSPNVLKLMKDPKVQAAAKKMML